MSEHKHGLFKLSMLVLHFGFAGTEKDASAACRNGLIRVDGERITDPEKQFSLATLSELQVGSEVCILKRAKAQKSPSTVPITKQQRR